MNRYVIGRLRLFLTLVPLLAGLVLLENAASLAPSRLAVQRIALLFILYGVILLRWRVAPIARLWQARLEGVVGRIR
jgi:hypothetical protein